MISDPSPATGKQAAMQNGIGRWVPLVVIAALTALAFTLGWHRLLSFKTVGLNYDFLKGFITDNFAAAILVYMLIYVSVVALSLPGGLIMTLSGGLLFGWLAGSTAAVIAATIGATLIFLIAKTSFGEVLAAKAGPSVAKLRQGFQDNALSYLLFLRLVPAFPFFVVNLAPALLGVPLRTYVIGTFFGIIPATVAFSVAGAGLGSVVEAQNAVYKACLAAAPSDPDTACPYTINTSELVTPQLLAAFALLGAVALIPVVLKRLRGRNGA